MMDVTTLSIYLARICCARVGTPDLLNFFSKVVSINQVFKSCNLEKTLATMFHNQITAFGNSSSRAPKLDPWCGLVFVFVIVCVFN